MTLDFTAARLNMIDSQVRTNDVPDLGVQDAMAAAPRERFCPTGREFLAYADAEVEYAPGWFLMKPRDIAKLLQALGPKAGERALCIAAPYAAMVLAGMGLEVTLRLPAGPARDVAATALSSVSVATDMSEIGAPISGAFDLVVVEGAVDKTPQAWLDSLSTSGAPGARLGVIERRGPVGKARVYLRSETGTVGAREVFDATPPLVQGFGPVAAFTF